MVSGYAGHSGGRHHGAHSAAAARELGVRPGGFLDFSQNINPLGAPPRAIEAAHRALDTEVGRYPDPGYPELRGALADYLGVSADVVVPTNGGAEAIFLAARASGDGGRALIPEPTFSEYAAAVRAAGMEPVSRIFRCPGSRFRPELDMLDDLEGFTAVFLCNPNNPTGDALPRDVVLRIASRAGESGATLIVDEAFADFAPGISVADAVGEGLYVARSFTKFFAVPGLRLGALLCPDPEKVRALQPSWSVNAVAAAAGAVAARDLAFIRESVSEVERLRRQLSDALGQLPGLRVFPGTANFLLARGPEGIVERLARRGVLVRGCEPFEGLGPGYFRVAVRGPEENRKLLAALREEL